MKTKEEMKRLRWFVYDLLTKTPYTPENPISQREVYEKCLEAGFDVTYDENQNQHNDHCRWLTKIVDELACDSDFDKVVWHFGYRYFCCDYEEAELLLRLREERIALASVRIRKLRKKVRRHRQGKLTTNTATPVEGTNRKFHKTFQRETLHARYVVEGLVKGFDEAEVWEKVRPDVPEERRLAVYSYEDKGRKETTFLLKWLPEGAKGE